MNEVYKPRQIYNRIKSENFFFSVWNLPILRLKIFEFHHTLKFTYVHAFISSQ